MSNRKSARVLGQEVGLTPSEMNFLLKEEGFLDGEPQNYTVTEKGKDYAEDNYNGSSYGYSNQGWPTRTWDDRILDELDITEGRKKEIRQAYSIAKQNKYKSEDDDISNEWDNCSNEDSDSTDSNNDTLVLKNLLIAAGLIGLGFGIYKAIPYIKCRWNDKVIPYLKNMNNNFTDNAEKIDGKAYKDKNSLDLNEI